MTPLEIGLFVLFCALLVGAMIFGGWMMVQALAWRSKSHLPKWADIQLRMQKYKDRIHNLQQQQQQQRQ